MHIFEDDQRWRALQLIKRRRKYHVGSCPRIYGYQQRTLRLPSDVVQRRERPRREECIAGAPQHRHFVLPPAELLQQRSLAEARLTLQECDTTAVADGGSQPFRQLGQTLFTLDEFH